MINKIRRASSATALTILLLSMPISSHSAPTKRPDLPPQAQIHVAPFRIIRIEYEGLTALAQAHYTTVDDPANHETSDFPGVAKLILDLLIDGEVGSVGCTGTLLLGGMHVLTAAHCVSDEAGNDILQSGVATFTNSGAEEAINIDSITIHPNWDGNFIKGDDIAILTLTSQASMTGYDIDRNSKDDIQSIGDKVGFGLSGMGTPEDTLTLEFGTKRNGQNKYDATADTMLKALGLRSGRDFVRGAVLQYDFDNGEDAHDAFKFFFGIPGLGLGDDEVSSAPGDSGGPTIKGGIIQGVTSYGTRRNGSKLLDTRISFVVVENF